MDAYLDHNATAPVLPAAARAAAAWMAGPPGNPSSVHGAGRRARAAIEHARRAVAAAVGARPAEIIFTSGATEAIALAVRGCVRVGDHVVVSAVEHPAVFGACAAAGARVTRVPVDSCGRIEPEAVAAVLRPETVLVAVMAAQNEIGNLYDPVGIARACGAVPLLCDAVQALGRVPFDVAASGAALVPVTSHKIGGPSGAGALWVRPDMKLAPLLVGGPQERGQRAGTENTPAIVGFGIAAEAIATRRGAMADVTRRRDALEARLEAAVEGFVVHGSREQRLPNTSSFRIDGVDGDVLLAALDLEGIQISSGSACSAGAVEPSPVLLALGLSARAARQGLRVSIGPETTAVELDRLATTLPVLVERIRAESAA